MRTLVTGASGFSGSIIIPALARSGFDVVGVYRRVTPFLARIPDEPRIRLVRHDLTDALALPGGPFEAIVHVGSSSPAPGTTTADIVRDNVGGTSALIGAALAWHSRRFVYFSSLSVYGEFAEPVVDENTPVRNPDAYGATKYLAECQLREISDRIPALSLRLPGLLGPGAHRNWMSGVAARLRRGDAIRAFHLDRPFNNAAYVSDLVALVARVLRDGWDGFDAVVIGARGIIKVRDAIERLERGLAVTASIEPVAPRNPSFILCCDRAIARYGYDPMNIEAMIDRYAQDILAWGA
jgi:nucleoside-diphosphate-sugar epimerase